ncbi:MAG: hypothetical protein IV090_05910 [Candidatus Sericytochromatia bacterium]|nr:hypothetical protein [Candidatus Sericytochromatia bacterium]
MNFKTIQDLQAKKETLNQERKANSHKYVEGGLSLLSKASESKFSHQQELSECHALFLKALQYNRKDPMPYIGLAHLRVIVGDRSLALKYVKKALRLDPNHTEAQNLFHFLARKSPAIPPEKKQIPEIKILDAEEECLGLQIAEHILALKQVLKEVESKVLQNKFDLLALDHYLSRQEIAYQTNLKQISIWSHRQGSDALYFQIKDWERDLVQLKKNRDLAQTYTQLEQEIQNLTGEVRENILALHRKQVFPLQAETLLEKYLDRCDYFADRLDNLEAQNRSIAILEPIYQELVENIEIFRNILDEILAEAELGAPSCPMVP